MPTPSTPDLAAQLAEHLPYLRRYGRALTGSQNEGDAVAGQVVEHVVLQGVESDAQLELRVLLFQIMQGIWKTAERDAANLPDAPGREGAVQRHLANLTPDTREALLLHTIEQFTHLEISQIMGMDKDEVTQLIDLARLEMTKSVAGKVLVIEDESIIAMELQGLVTEMGHQVVGIARTHKDAVQMVDQHVPDLILADIQLADKSSGIDAVNDVLGRYDDILIIFITAFPEKLLTGNRPEPAFLISKPYTEDQVRSAVSQAMLYASAENLTV